MGKIGKNEDEFLTIQNADVVSDASGRQYHIDLAPGELSEYVLMVGDPQRSVRAAESYLKDIRVSRHNREFYSYTGMYKGLEVTIMSTGIGPSNTEIAVIECSQIAKKPVFIRVGTCGSLQPQIKLGDMIISSAAVRLEDTSTYFVHEGYPSVANYEVLIALLSACESEKLSYHVGITGTASGFYGAQGRKIPGVHLRYPNLQEDLAEMNVANFEMESSTLFTLTTMMGLRASTLCLAIAQRQTGGFISPEMKKEGEHQALTAGLDGLVELAKMDAAKAKAGKRYWVPSLGVKPD